VLDYNLHAHADRKQRTMNLLHLWRSTLQRKEKRRKIESLRANLACTPGYPRRTCSRRTIYCIFLAR